MYGALHNRSYLTDQQAEVAYRLFAQGMTKTDLARRYGLAIQSFDHWLEDYRQRKARGQSVTGNPECTRFSERVLVSECTRVKER